jgi:hypothetical protein
MNRKGTEEMEDRKGEIKCVGSYRKKNACWEEDGFGFEFRESADAMFTLRLYGDVELCVFSQGNGLLPFKGKLRRQPKWLKVKLYLTI